VGRKREKKKKTFLLSIQKMGIETQNGGSNLLILYSCTAVGIHMVKDNGPWWLWQVVKQEGLFKSQ
jgi:hypothetical protein